VGYKLEVPPLHPALASTLLGGTARNALRMAELPHTHAMLALLRDGFHPDSPAGPWNCAAMARRCSTIRSPTTWDGLRRAFHSMAEIQFAAGAKRSCRAQRCQRYVKPGQAAMIDGLSLELFRTRLGSAHVMGGCAMGEDPRQGGVRQPGPPSPAGNLSIHDGSLFPTSIGANPQLSVYAISANWRSAGRRLANA
jgi:choline dehydrogenase-like flavoprotein